MGHSLIFTQILSKLQLYTVIHSYTPFKYPTEKLASEIDHFVILPKLTKTFFKFKMSKIKISKMSKTKIQV